MLQAVAEKFRRCVRALVLPVVVFAAIFAAPIGGFAAEVDSQFLAAAVSGDTAKVERLLAGGADINYKDSDGIIALIYASFNDHRATIARPLKRCWHGARQSMCKTTMA